MRNKIKYLKFIILIIYYYEGASEWASNGGVARQSRARPLAFLGGKLLVERPRHTLKRRLYCRLVENGGSNERPALKMFESETEGGYTCDTKRDELVAPSCAICLSQSTNNLCALSCGHVFHPCLCFGMVPLLKTESKVSVL